MERKGGQAPRRRLGAAAAFAALAACALAACAPQTPYEAPTFPFAARFAGAPAGLPVLLADDPWWRRLGDPLLDRLVAAALAGNVTLAVAEARVAEAEAERARAAGVAALVPSAAARLAGEPAEGRTEARAGLDLPLEGPFDPGGGRRAAREAAGARAEAAGEDRAAARLVVAGQLVAAYLDLRLQQRRAALARAELAGRGQTLDLARRLAAAGAATAVDVTRAEARLADLRARLPAIEAAAATRRAEIAVLAGVAPGALPADLAAGLAAAGAQPRPTLAPDVGIPADLLRNRPDIRAAERRYYAALADVGAARAALYPRLSLAGTIALTARGAGAAGFDYLFGPVLTLPALPDGPARAGVEAAHARARAAHGAWKSAVLGALVEVEAALLDYRAATAGEAAAARAARLWREALAQTRALAAAGEATLSDLIEAEGALSAAETVLAEAAFRRAAAFATLNLRLGAGHAAGG